MNADARAQVKAAQDERARLRAEVIALNERVDLLEGQATDLREKLNRSQSALRKARQSRDFYRWRSLDLTKRSAA